MFGPWSLIGRDVVPRALRRLSRFGCSCTHGVQLGASPTPRSPSVLAAHRQIGRVPQPTCARRRVHLRTAHDRQYQNEKGRSAVRERGNHMTADTETVMSADSRARCQPNPRRSRGRRVPSRCWSTVDVWNHQSGSDFLHGCPFGSQSFSRAAHSRNSGGSSTGAACCSNSRRSHRS